MASLRGNCATKRAKESGQFHGSPRDSLAVPRPCRQGAARSLSIDWAVACCRFVAASPSCQHALQGNDPCAFGTTIGQKFPASWREVTPLPRSNSSRPSNNLKASSTCRVSVARLGSAPRRHHSSLAARPVQATHVLSSQFRLGIELQNRTQSWEDYRSKKSLTISQREDLSPLFVQKHGRGRNLRVALW